MADTDPPGTDENRTSELTNDFSETARILFSAGSVDDTLTAVVRLALATIEACDFAGIFLVNDGVVSTPVHTDPIVVRADALQHQTGQGPCLDAINHGVSYYAGELADDPRWPDFGPQATAIGMRSLLALPLLAEGILGALNLYARYPSAFGVIDRARGLLLGALAGQALASAQLHEDEDRRSDQLHSALATREMIGQAQGILMERESITADQAFDILRRASQHLNVKLREVAQNLIDTGERPDTGRGARPMTSGASE